MGDGRLKGMDPHGQPIDKHGVRLDPGIFDGASHGDPKRRGHAAGVDLVGFDVRHAHCGCQGENLCGKFLATGR